MLSNWLKKLDFMVNFNSTANSITAALQDFYNLIWIYIIFIVFIIGYWMIFVLFNFNFKKNILINFFNRSFIFKGYIFLTNFWNTSISDRLLMYTSIHDVKDYPQMEASWCFVPVSFVSTVAYPSVALEYGLSPDINPLVTLKVIAHQWYWIFEVETNVSPGVIGTDDLSLFSQSELCELYDNTYGDSAAFFEGLSEMDNFKTLKRRVEVNLHNDDPNFFRLLALDTKVLLPADLPIKVIITSVDVIHSFTLPRAGVKMDAVPGRTSEQTVVIHKPGLYWGQCSELCGPYHAYMPVVFEVTDYQIFLKSFYEKI